MGWRSIQSEIKSTSLFVLKNCKYLAKDYGGSVCVGGLLLWGYLFGLCFFVCFIAKENLFPFQKSEIPNIETVPCLFKNLEKCKKQMGVMITLKCRTLISDSMSVTGR